MCTLKEFEHDVFETEKMANEIITSADDIIQTSDTKSVCKTCGCQEIQISLRNKNGYCKICFLSLLMHKFKATLGKSKSVRPSDSILIAHSGKANSTVLTHLVKANMKESVSKRLRFQCKILYIDDGMVKGYTVEEREFIRAALAKEAEHLQLATYVVSLSKCTTDNIYEKIQLVNVPQIRVTQEDVVIQETFNKLESDTAKDELLRQLKRKLLVTTARMLNCNKIFVADTSVDLAIKILGNISTGRGSQLPFDVAFSDARCTDVTLLRPLRDFTGDDIVGYLNCCELYPVLSSRKYNHSFPTSIRSIARNFVCQLDSEFYSTVSTIYRTSEKLAAKLEKFNSTNINVDADANDTDLDNTCVLCELSLDSCYSQNGELSVVQAKLFSKLVSTIIDPQTSHASNEQIESLDNPKQDRCYCHTGTCNPLQRETLQSQMVETCLCYGCKLIFLDSNQTYNILPSFVLNAIKKKLHIMCLRKEIRDFLL